ncbi:hypothetical protein MIMGU_mgv1a018381mg [Erythranthe guttata]|uniref:DUF674 domain-containing protein n=1 Tax=Erythranthe guttata TaxID=4155 RepID=A0A022R7B8_ERYGU|nr:PREDICTED: uncharacterized protein LOC105958714 [Erythranthe guttata]EYU36141.1 hypothetical protein MIMGU_mgv1a018381mg [Erythranthe guttata]|eukprot:XP_012838173.1 PREDICTED: uncharacterized protein LOC105958714 [Erythranthe guttata]
MANSSVSMKLLIDTHAKRVLFAETDKDCVDFMFYILSLPVANLVNLVGKKQMVGSLGNLYESIENLNQSYIQPNKTKDSLLKPVTAHTSGSHVPLLALQAAPTTVKKFYTCTRRSSNDYDDYCYSNNNNCNSNVSDDPNAVCPHCNGAMSISMNYVAPPPKKESNSSSNEEGLGFVKGVVTYMVMDDLVVEPMSTDTGHSGKIQYELGPRQKAHGNSAQ